MRTESLKPLAAGAAAVAAELKVLVVEDSTADARLLREALADAGAHVDLDFVSTLDSEEAALGTLQRGVQDYLVKGRYDGSFILRVIRRAMERNRVLNEVDQLREYQYYVATHDALTGLPNRQLFGTSC
jgi:PleD family two-component response regulator